MNNIRKIIEERLELAKEGLELCRAYDDNNYPLTNEDLVINEITIYEHFLDLMQPRTEQDILNDFEKLGWKVTQNDDGFIILCFNSIARIVILKQTKTYHINGATNMQEHKLLNELFEVWQW